MDAWEREGKDKIVSHRKNPGGNLDKPGNTPV